LRRLQNRLHLLSLHDDHAVGIADDNVARADVHAADRHRMFDPSRRERNDIVIDSIQASREHAIITVEPAFITIKDLGSRNGTFVNGDRIESQALAHGDTIRLGNYEMRFIAGDQEFSQIEALRLLTIPGLLVDLDRAMRRLRPISRRAGAESLE
jgi:pSer/pThr/pTyr-binding forkhead associated (FHA) protein